MLEQHCNFQYYLGVPNQIISRLGAGCFMACGVLSLVELEMHVLFCHSDGFRVGVSEGAVILYDWHGDRRPAAGMSKRCQETVGSGL